ncbi:MAG TPA: LysR family transcriptional regulator [Solirubrobacteraceae bacterium]|nr:LysR family transcriptional regulator [Solirubrobacteraceae bacterium]
MELRQLRAFVQVANAGTFTRAADELHLAQSAVSQAVSRLEAELGFELLRRTSRGVELTDAGRHVFERAREVVAGADAIRSDLAALRGLLEGNVALGTMLPPGPVDLPGLLARFHDAHPGIGVRVREGSAPEILALLRRDVLDVAFTGLPADALDDGLAGEQVLSEELLLIAPPGHGLGTGSLTELSGVPFIGYRRGSALRDTVDDALRAASASPQIVFESDELVSVRELVARDLGVSIVPRSTVEGEGPEIEAIPIGLARPLTLAWRERRQPPAAAAFLSFVREAAAARRLPLVG